MRKDHLFLFLSVWGFLFSNLYSNTVVTVANLGQFVTEMNGPSYDNVDLNSNSTLPYTITLSSTQSVNMTVSKDIINLQHPGGWTIDTNGFFNMSAPSLTLGFGLNLSGTPTTTLKGVINVSANSFVNIDTGPFDFQTTFNLDTGSILSIESMTGNTLNATLNMNGALLFNGDIVSPNILTLSGANINVLSGGATFEATFGPIQLIGGSLQGTGPLTINAESGSSAAQQFLLTIPIPQFTGELILQYTNLVLSGSGSIENISKLTIDNVSGGALGGIDISNVTTPLGAYTGSSIPILTQSGTLASFAITLGNNYLALGAGSYSGPLAGAGGLIKTGTGTLVLGGSTPYTGETRINLGSLILFGSASLSTSSLVNVVDALDISGVSGSSMTLQNFSGSGSVWFGGKNVVLSNSSALTWSGSLGGSGGVTITSSGIIFSGINSYTGVTTLAAGVLTLSGNGSIASSPLQMVSGTTLNISPAMTTIGSFQGATILNLSGTGSISLGSNYILAQNMANTSFTGTVSGSGGLIKTGSASLTLSGVQSYTGTTTVIEGILSLASGSSIASSGAVVNNGDLNGAAVTALTLNNISGTGTLELSTTLSDSVVVFCSSDQTYSGVINGGATLQKTGSAKWNLTNSSPFSGLIQVVNGKLGVNGNIGSAQLNIQSGGAVYGSGTVATLSNNGKLSPGNSIGTITVNGNYTQTGILDMEISQTGQADMLIVSGTVTINPGSTLIVNPLAAGHYAAGQLFTIIQAGAPVTTTFTNLIVYKDFDMSVVYNGNLVQLLNTTNTHVTPVPPSIIPDNPGKMATAMFCPSANSTGDMDYIKAQLVTLDAVNFLAALQKIVPMQISSVAVVELENNDRVVDLIQNRIYRLNEDFCTSTKNLPKWTVWATPSTFWLWQNAQTGTFAFDSNTTGFVVGFENNVVENLLVGAGAGYTHSGVTWKGSNGKGLMNEFYWAPYLAYRYNDLYFAGSLMGSYDAVEVQRTMNFNAVDRTATGHFNQWNLTTMLNMQAFLRLKGEELYMLPEGDIVFTQLFRQTATESGAGALDMSYAFNFNSVMRVYLNWAAGLRICPEKDWFYDIRGHIGYQNTTIFTRNDIRATFVYADQVCLPTVDLDGSLPAPNQGVAGGSITWQNQDHYKMELKGDYTFGGRSHALELDLAMEFNF